MALRGEHPADVPVDAQSDDLGLLRVRGETNQRAYCERPGWGVSAAPPHASKSVRGKTEADLWSTPLRQHQHPKTQGWVLLKPSADGVFRGLIQRPQQTTLAKQK